MEPFTALIFVPDDMSDVQAESEMRRQWPHLVDDYGGDAVEIPTIVIEIDPIYGRVARGYGMARRVR